MPAIAAGLFQDGRIGADQNEADPGTGMSARQRHAQPVRYAGDDDGARRQPRRTRREIVRRQSRERIGPVFQPIDKSGNRAGLRGALVVPALDLRRADQRAQKRGHQIRVGRGRRLPEAIERRLAGQPGNIENGIAERLHGNPGMQRRDPDRAVDRHDPGGVAQQFGGRPSGQREDAVGDAELARQPGNDPVPGDQPVIERMRDKDQLAGLPLRAKDAMISRTASRPSRNGECARI